MFLRHIFGFGDGTASQKGKLNSRHRRAGSKLRLEALEHRALLSATAHPSVVTVANNGPVQYEVIVPEQTNVGKQADFEVLALDAAGHPTAGYDGSASLSETPTGVTATVAHTSTGRVATPLPTSVTFHNGVAFFQGSFATAGTTTVTATETDAVNASPITGSATTTVNAATTATQLFVFMPAHETPGKPVNVTVEALDASGNVVPTYTGDVMLTGAFTGSPVSYQFSATDAGKHTFQVTFPTTTSGQQTVTATDNSTVPLTGSVSTNLTSPGTVTSLFVRLPDNVQAGAATYVTVEALNANNQPVSSYTGTVSFTASVGTTATLPANYTFTSSHRWWSDDGEHTFQVTFGATGTQGFTVADTGNSGLTSTVSTNVYAAPAATHLLVVAPENSPTGYSVPVLVIALDAADHPVKDYTATLSLAAAPSTGVTITGPTTPRSAVEGVQVFRVTFTTAGSSDVLTATDTNGLTASATTNVVTPPARRGFGGFGFGGFDR